MKLFQVSHRRLPAEERYSLTDQSRRSSHSVCANLREAWAKRRFEAHSLSKLTDADGENGKTDTWLDFACDCGYMMEAEHRSLTAQCKEVGSMLGDMIKHPESFLIKPL